MGRRKRKQKPGAGRVAFDIEAYGGVVADFKTLETRVAANMTRHIGKSPAHAARYGMSGARIRAMMHGETQYIVDPVERFVDPDRWNLSDDEWRWAVAFRKVLGVGHEFYEYAPRPRRKWLEQHYKELARNDTPKGRKAAKVVAVFVQYKLADRTPRASGWVNPQMQMYRSMTGSMTNMPTFHNIPKGKP